jgi:hypothetical protein
LQHLAQSLYRPDYLFFLFSATFAAAGLGFLVTFAIFATAADGALSTGFVTAVLLGLAGLTRLVAGRLLVTFATAGLAFLIAALCTAILFILGALFVSAACTTARLGFFVAR